MLEDDDVEMAEAIEHDYLDAIMLDLRVTVEQGTSSITDFSMMEDMANREVINMMDIEQEEEVADYMEYGEDDEVELDDNPAKKPKLEDAKECDVRWKTGSTGPRMPRILPLVREKVEVESNLEEPQPGEEGVLKLSIMLAWKRLSTVKELITRI